MEKRGDAHARSGSGGGANIDPYIYTRTCSGGGATSFSLTSEPAEREREREREREERAAAKWRIRAKSLFAPIYTRARLYCFRERGFCMRAVCTYIRKAVLERWGRMVCLGVGWADRSVCSSRF